MTNFNPNRIKPSAPSIYGLVLAGGKSRRMGEDKSMIRYHHKVQLKHTFTLLQSYCNKVYISMASYNSVNTDFSTEIIVDSYKGLGPFGGLLSAFNFNSEVAWLTLACDLPYLDNETIEDLIKNRDPTKYASCFYNHDTNLPEPLVTIWEPKIFPVLLNFLKQGIASPRKVLQDYDVNMIQMTDPIKMTNVNTPEQKKSAINYFNKMKG